MTLDDIKYEVAVANRVLWATGLSDGITASLGHASLRVPDQPDRFVVKGRGYALDALSAMQPADMVVCDTDGFLIDGPVGATQCYEVKMHSCIYKLYPEVQSVVHVHPRHTVLLTVLGVNIKPMCQEGLELVARELPVYPHTKIVQTEEEGMEVARLLRGFDAVLLQGHGAATTGRSLEQAVTNMLHLEEHARMNYQALAALGPDYPSLPLALIEENSAVRIPFGDLPHLKEPIARAAAQRSPDRRAAGGLWQYYTAQVSGDLRRHG